MPIKPIKNQMKVVAITGGSDGIGLALAEVYLSKGYQVAICGRNQKKLDFAFHKLNALKKGEVFATVADVSEKSDCKNFIQSCLAKFGRIDVLINNAGISMRAIFTDTKISVLKSLMDINFWGTVYCTKYALSEILKNKGSIIGISSLAGIKGLPGRTGYSASKFAMNGFLEALKLENRSNNLHVLIVCPGYTKSNIRNTALVADGKIQAESPLNEASLMPAEEVAEAIYKAMIRKKEFLTLTSQGKLLFWLNKFFPTWVDRLVYKTIRREPGTPVS